MPDIPLVHPIPAPDNTEELVDLMLFQLLRLPYPALTLCVQRLLVNLGYQEVSILNRQFLRGRTNHGGVDMVAKTATPLGLMPAVIQVKKVAAPIPRAAIDLIRGVMLRHGAPHGLLITTSTFAGPALDAAGYYPGRPVRTVDCLELARLMVDARVGVRDVIDTTTGARTVEFDHGFFETIEESTNLQVHDISCNLWGGK